MGIKTKKVSLYADSEQEAPENQRPSGDLHVLVGKPYIQLPIPLCVPNAVFFLGVPVSCGGGNT